MNIRFIIGNSVDSGTGVVSAVNEKVLPLCGQGKPEGTASGLMPLQLSAGVVVTPEVTVYSSTSTNRRKAVSAVVKVSIPYHALKLTDDGTGIAGVDPTRSGGELAMHTVITLPAAAVADLQGANGAASTKNAEGQLAVVSRILTALLLQRLIDPGYAVADLEAFEVGAKPYRLVVNGTVGAVDPTLKLTTSSLVPTDAITGYAGNVGFDITSYAPSRSLNEVLARISAGKAALGCHDVKAESTVLYK